LVFETEKTDHRAYRETEGGGCLGGSGKKGFMALRKKWENRI